MKLFRILDQFRGIDISCVNYYHTDNMIAYEATGTVRDIKVNGTVIWTPSVAMVIIEDENLD